MLGSRLASWIPSARMGLEASEPRRAQVEGQFLVPPTPANPVSEHGTKEPAFVSLLSPSPPAHPTAFLSITQASAHSCPLHAPTAPPGRASYFQPLHHPSEGSGFGRHQVRSPWCCAQRLLRGAVFQGTLLPVSSRTRASPRWADGSPCCLARTVLVRAPSLPPAAWMALGRAVLLCWDGGGGAHPPQSPSCLPTRWFLCHDCKSLHFSKSAML